MTRVFASSELQWKGNGLWCGRQKLTRIVQDTKYPSMWRVELPDGNLSDMVNITRARDAARGIALQILNGQETRPGGAPVR